jgi:Aspartate/ornithine carbamoyltransferase, carbamoyl-P binding domain
MDLRGRSLLTITDLSAEEFMYLVELGRKLRAETRFGFGFDERRLAGRNIALIFEETSPRTRAAFEVAAHDEGAHVSYLGPGDTQLGREESVRDAARVLGRMFDGIAYCGFSQESVETLGACAGVPVWNAPRHRLAARHGHPRLRAARAAALVGRAGYRWAARTMVARPADRHERRGGRGRRRGFPVHRHVAADGQAGGGPGRADRPAACLPGEVLGPHRHRQSGRQVPALPAGPAQPGYWDEPAAPREARPGGPRGHRGGLRIAGLDRFDQAENRMHTIKALMVATLARGT